MSRLRTCLAGELARKVNRHQLVIWDDPDQRYVEVAQEVVPAGAAFAAYDGSWFALRKAVEPALSGSRAATMVVYIPERPLEQDPLEELRAAAAQFKLSLGALLKKALGGELTEARIAELAKQARTLLEAEAALDTDGALDARLVSIFRTGELNAIAEQVLIGGRGERLDAEGAWPLVNDALAAHLGSPSLTSNAEAPGSLFRHLALAVLAAGLGDLPERIAAAVSPVSPAQAVRASAVLDRLRRPEHLARHRVLAEHFDAEMSLPASLSWAPGLAGLDPSPGIEELALEEGLALLSAGDHHSAHRLAEQRLATSRWAQPQASQPATGALCDQPHLRWAAANRIAILQGLIQDYQPPSTTSSATLLAWYAEVGWRVDQAHRLSEIARADLGHLGALDTHAIAASGAYLAWLEAVVSATTAAVVNGGLEVGTMARQGEVYSLHVKRAPGPTAYFMVDALRFELGQALAARLGRDAESCQPAVAGVPTITPVGMPNLLPGAADGLSVSLYDGKVLASVGGAPIRNVGDRLAAIRRAAGAVLDLDFSALMARSDQRLGEEIAGMDVVLVRSTDIDAAGESGRAGTAWRSVDGMIGELATQIQRLGRLGVRRAVISSDHGFIVLPEQLAGARVLERPSGEGDMHIRCWVGRGGVTPAGAARVALSSLGVGGGLDLMVPEGLAVFPARGSRQFFHGGLSPQELVVPVLVLDLDAPPGPGLAPEVTITMSGKGITTGVFAATITLASSLAGAELAVRVVARAGSGPDLVARLVAGDGFDPATVVVRVTSSSPAVLTFGVTARLAKGTKVDLAVLHGNSGVELARAVAKVLADVGAGGDWL
ncbi:MAG: PglZ domain-containing protein [Acidimicrobiales bacterium]